MAERVVQVANSNIFFFVLFLMLIYAGLVGMMGMGVPELSGLQDVITEPWPSFHSTNVLDGMLYVAEVIGAGLIKAGATGRLIFEVQAFAEASMAGIPLFTMINLGFLVVLGIGVLDMAKP